MNEDSLLLLIKRQTTTRGGCEMLVTSAERNSHRTDEQHNIRLVTIRIICVQNPVNSGINGV
jgi:hypothetical protein